MSTTADNRFYREPGHEVASLQRQCNVLRDELALTEGDLAVAVAEAVRARGEVERLTGIVQEEQRESREAGQIQALACHLGDISARVTASYPDGMDPELVMRRRVNKVGNEYGETLDAIEGWTGENPRKGVYATKDDVVNELLDCASASLCAVEHLTGDEGQALLMLAERVGIQADRLRAALTGGTDEH